VLLNPWYTCAVCSFKHKIFIGFSQKVLTCIFLQLSQLKKEDVIALAKSIDGFLSSDVGKMAQMAVFAAFPEMKVAEGVAMPVLRQFIKKVTLS